MLASAHLQMTSRALQVPQETIVLWKARLVKTTFFIRTLERVNMCVYVFAAISLVSALAALWRKRKDNMYVKRDLPFSAYVHPYQWHRYILSSPHGQ